MSNPPYSTLKTPHSASRSDVQDFNRIFPRETASEDLQAPHLNPIRRAAAHFPGKSVQDYPRILQFSPPRRPCARCAITAPTGRARARRVPGLPPALVLPGGGSWAAGLCRRLASLAAQAAQLLGRPSRLAGTHTGAPRARPPAPQAARGRAKSAVLHGFQRHERAHPGRISSSPTGARTHRALLCQ